MDRCSNRSTNHCSRSSSIIEIRESVFLMSMKQKKETKAKIAALEAAIGTESTEGTILARIKALEDAQTPSQGGAGSS